MEFEVQRSETLREFGFGLVKLVSRPARRRRGGGLMQTICIVRLETPSNKACNEFNRNFQYYKKRSFKLPPQPANR
jgi:hypothetical protein